MLGVLFFLLALLALSWAVAFFFLRGEDLSRFDQPAGRRFGSSGAPSSGLAAVVASLGRAPQLLKGVPRSRHIGILRDYLDNLFASDDLPATFTPVEAGGVPGEWVAAPNADPARRVLYIHGGAFMMGSPKSHRRLTSKFSEVAGAAVLAIDYRLMPEHPRLAAVEDCRRAYRWMIENGPNGAGEASAVFVAGDSAGGNLALSLITWVRDQGLRAPDAAVALSPLTDSTMGSPSLRANIGTDPMLGPLVGPLARVPKTILLWFGWIRNRVNPRDPVVSPVYADLSELPPVLVQASEAEMLHDDARRWVNKAVAAGSPAVLQTWPHMVHVWQIFHPELPEGREAIAEIGKFLDAVTGGPRQDARKISSSSGNESTTMS